MSHGSLYALLALGLVLTLKSTNTLNFAQGEISMVMAFVCFAIWGALGQNLWISILPTVLIAAAFGAAIYNLAIYPFRNRDQEGLAIISLALKLVITGGAALYWGPDAKVFPHFFQADQVSILGLHVAPNQLAIIAAGIIGVSIIGAFLRYTTLGLSMRVAAENPNLAQLLGINLRLVGSTAWAMAAALGAITGMLVASTLFLSPYMMGLVIMKGFAALVLGGMMSPFGAVAGGLLLGLLESGVAYSLTPLYQDSVGLVLMIVVLLIRPSGLFQTRGAWRA
ncbi:MAG: branched-chain amino acid ABC transporter permease [Alphaproteobacteria bacterium]